MKSFAFLSFALLEGAFLCEASTTLLKCNADNCYRAMTNTPAVASSMCTTYLQATTTTTITPTVTISYTDTILPNTVVTPLAKAVPTHISSQCVLATAAPLELRLSSACSCIGAQPTSSTTVTATAFAPAQTITVDPPAVCDTATFSGSAGTYDVDGLTYNLGCNSTPGGWTIFQYASAAHFADCIAECPSVPGCIGVWWDVNETAAQKCGLLSGFQFPTAQWNGVSYAFVSTYTPTNL